MERSSFDVFISARSLDDRYAWQVHEFLSSHGLKPFFAPASIPVVGISEYGHVIDAVLSTAEHLVLVASRADYVLRDSSPWVHHEWRTFHNLKLGGLKRGNLLTILCENLRPRDLPVPLSTSYHAIPLAGLEDLLRFMTNVDDGPLHSADALKGSTDEQGMVVAAATVSPSKPEGTREAMIRMIPGETALVPEHSIFPKLVEHFAEVFGDPTTALLVLKRANAWRMEADPHKRPRTIVVLPADVPPPTSVSARTFWQNVWSLARLKGARTVGSLLASAEDEGATYPKALQDEIGNFVDSLYRM